MLEKELEKKCEELHIAMSRMSHGDMNSPGNNGLRKEIWTSTPLSGRSTPSSIISGRGVSHRSGRHHGAVPDSPTSAAFSPLSAQKQGRIVISSLFQGFAWESGDKYSALGEHEEEEEDLPQYTVRILPVVVPGIAINDELIQEPRKMHMAVNVRLESEKKPKAKHDSGRLERSSSVISLDGVDDDTISGFSDMTKDSSTVDGDNSSLEDSSDDGSGSGSGSDDDSDLD